MLGRLKTPGLDIQHTHLAYCSSDWTVALCPRCLVCCASVVNNGVFSFPYRLSSPPCDNCLSREMKTLVTLSPKLFFPEEPEQVPRVVISDANSMPWNVSSKIVLFKTYSSPHCWLLSYTSVGCALNDRLWVEKMHLCQNSMLELLLGIYMFHFLQGFIFRCLSVAMCVLGMYVHACAMYVHRWAEAREGLQVLCSITLCLTP